MEAILRKLLRKDQLPDLGITESPSTLLRWEAAGLFPKRAKLAGFRVAWDQAEIQAWIDRQFSQSK
ncbi:AlpA family phage regulatory protein [Parvularcula marina]|uniref:AlpA family phage regulatory protein n=2 Tax=Parvularcula marina TaxID=2292771 RepID=A0A371R7I5_9PROT|nr:AlpA family phage regulatory protein [Parvularcula marina]